MSEQYIFTPNKTNSGVIAWETPPVAFNINQNDENLTESMNESYVTAIDDDTHYLSILDSSNERTLEALHDLTLENEGLEGGNVESLSEDCNETGEQQMLIFNMDGLDDLYGIQFAQNEDGILQKYQFKFRQNENGTLEAVPETIQILPNNEAPEQDQDYDETVVGNDNFESFANTQMLDVDRSSEHSERDFEDFNCFKAEQELNLELNEGSDDSNQIEDDDDGVHDFDKRSESTEIKTEDFSDHKVAILHEFNYINELNGNDAVELETEESHDGYDNILLDNEPKLKEIRLHDSDNIEYDIDDDFSITDSKGLVQSVLETSAAALKAENSHILRQALAGNTTETNKKVKKQLLYYVIPTPEKENLTTLEAFKPNPRSILKPQPIKTKLPSPSNETLKNLEKLERRYSRSREAVEAKMFNNFINKTTVPQVPVRQTRLPRKQEIKPVDNRREEEIIVKEVMISSNGFIESVEDRFKNKDKLEIVSYITLEDSDEENPRSKGKKKESVIEILSSDDESGSKPKTTKRGRGRPRKSEVVIKKRDHDDQHEDLISEESSPSKKSRSDSSSKDSDLKQELNCPHCPKTFPSPNSLKTHIQHHNLENRMQKRMTTFQYKHKCEDCELTFKNALLLQRHDCKKKTKTEICRKILNDMAALNLQNAASKYVCSKCQTSFKNAVLQSRHVCPKENKWQCGVCKAKFNDITIFNAHKRKHMKESMMMKTTDVQIPVRKSLDAKSVDKSARQSMIPTKIVPSIKVAKKFSCQNCHMKFTSRLLLDTHKRRSCVKPKMDSKPKVMNVSPKKRCVQCTECQEKFTTYSDMTKHKIEEHGCASVQKSMKRKYGGKVKYMSGIPPNPKLREAIQDLAKNLDDLPK